MERLVKILQESLNPELQWQPMFNKSELNQIIMWSEITQTNHPLATKILIGKN